MERLSSSEEDTLVNLDVSPRGNRLREFFNREPCLARGIVIIVSLIILVIVFVIVLSLTSSINGTDASLYLRESHRHHTCDEEKFGCCMVYLQCSNKHTYLDFDDITLSHYRVLPRSRDHSNCPSLEYLIAEYNEHYGPKDDDCGEYGCCENSYDIGCDKTIRETFKTGNNEDTISALQNNTKIMEIKIAKENKEGTNCKSHNSRLYDVINSYDSLYPDKSRSTDVLAIVLLILGLWIALAVSS
tara:strand:- start:1622 stop:2353 length:732 start_codon:yes stop_codon:yes gene_type:complete